MSDDEFKAQQQQEQMMQMAQQGLGPAVNALGGMAKQGIANDGKSQPSADVPPAGGQ